MKRPIWFADEIDRISEKKKITAVEAEAFIVASIDKFAKQYEGNMTMAYEAYNQERNYSIDEEYYVEEYMRERGVTEEVAIAWFKSMPF